MTASNSVTFVGHINLLAYSDFEEAAGLGVPWREILLVILVAAIVTFFTTGLTRVIANRAGAVAVPRERDVHVIPTPRWGGVGIYTGVIVAFIVASKSPALARGFGPPDMNAVIVGATIIVIVGIVDDRWGIDAFTKLAGQITAASVMVLLGLYWFQIYVPVGDIGTLVLDPLQSGVLTVLVTVTVINAINFVDGLDGLAAGLGLIAALAILALSISVLFDQGGAVSAYPPALIAAILAGACIGFLPHNFQPARIFMGDSGAMLIGLMLAAASTSASGRITLNGYGVGDILVLLSPLLVVAAAVFVPMLDLVLAIVRRTRAGRSPFAADKMHLHHRLLEWGHTQRRTVLIIYLWVAFLALSAVTVSILSPAVHVPSMAAMFVLAMTITIIPRMQSRMRIRRQERYRVKLRKTSVNR